MCIGFVLILILLEVTQIMTAHESLEGLCVLILILLEVTQIKHWGEEYEHEVNRLNPYSTGSNSNGIAFIAITGYLS